MTTATESNGPTITIGTAASKHQTFRDSDVLARLVGDEFVALLTDCADSQALIDRLKANAETFAQENNLPYPLSLSVGLAVSPAEAPKPSLNHLIAEADAAMYAQKQRRQPLNIAALKAAQRWGSQG